MSAFLRLLSLPVRLLAYPFTRVFAALPARDQRLLLTRLLPPLCAVACAFACGAAGLALMGYAPGQAVVDIWKGAQIGKWGFRDDFGKILYNATPLLFTGLAVAAAFRTGLFNIGAGGQMLVACLACAWVGAHRGVRGDVAVTIAVLGGLSAFAAAAWAGAHAPRPGVPGRSHLPAGVIALSVLGPIVATLVIGLDALPGAFRLPLAVGAGIAAGALWGAIPGLLKAWRGAHEVIITIMMNFIAAALTGYLATYPLKESAGALIPQTAEVVEGMRIPRLPALLASVIELPPYVQANLSLGVGLALAVAVWVFLWHTRWGYELRAVGLNQSAAEYAGIRVGRSIFLAMALSGALAGATCLDFVCGQKYRYMHDDAFAYAQNGFLGIAVALLGHNHPGGVVVAAFFFGSLVHLGSLVDVNTTIPKDLVLVLQAVIILFLIVGNEIFRRLAERRAAAMARLARGSDTEVRRRAAPEVA
ncbi:MAG: ABC transporter permease [Planctomycetes bacterium]|nr:ABC transporter permease [Planctomycetota bacterium]